MKSIRNSVLLAVVVAGAVTSSAWAPASAEQGSAASQLKINDNIQYHYFYHPPSFYDPAAAPVTSHEQPARTPVSKKYDTAFVKSKSTAHAVATPAATSNAAETVTVAPVQLLPITVVAPQGDVPTTPEQKAAQMREEFGIPASELQGLTMQQLTDLDMKIRTIQRLHSQYQIAPETLVHQSLDALQQLEWKLQQGR
ncbi:MAG: hypothetical protein WCC10_17750 [Tumebacillaceae bacterium]